MWTVTRRDKRLDAPMRYLCALWTAPCLGAVVNRRSSIDGPGGRKRCDTQPIHYAACGLVREVRRVSDRYKSRFLFVINKTHTAITRSALSLSLSLTLSRRITFVHLLTLSVAAAIIISLIKVASEQLRLTPFHVKWKSNSTSLSFFPFLSSFFHKSYPILPFLSLSSAFWSPIFLRQSEQTL